MSISLGSVNDRGYAALNELSSLSSGKQELPTLISSSAKATLEQYNNTTTFGWAGNVASTTLKNSVTYIGIPFTVLYVANNVLSLGSRRDVSGSNAGLVVSALLASAFAVPHIYRNAKCQADQEYNTGIGLYLVATAQQQAHIMDLAQKVDDYVQAAFDSQSQGVGVYKMLEDAQKNLDGYKKKLRNEGFRSGDVDKIVNPLAKTLQSWLQP